MSSLLLVQRCKFGHCWDSSVSLFRCCAGRPWPCWVGCHCRDVEIFLLGMCNLKTLALCGIPLVLCLFAVYFQKNKLEFLYSLFLKISDTLPPEKTTTTPGNDTRKTHVLTPSPNHAINYHQRFEHCSCSTDCGSTSARPAKVLHEPGILSQQQKCSHSSPSSQPGSNLHPW